MPRGMTVRKIYLSDKKLWRLNLPRELAKQVGIGLGDLIEVSVTTGGGLLLTKVPMHPLVQLDARATP